MCIRDRHIDNRWVFGNKSFVPMMMEMRNLLAGHKIFSFLSYVMFNYLFNWNDILWDRPLRDRHFLFSPVHISVKLMQWWLSLNPVSYTHLDVYKRQVHFRAVPSKSSRTGFFSLWWVDYFLSSHTLWHFFVLLGVIGHYNASVSYTHLDVYKRQTLVR